MFAAIFEVSAAMQRLQSAPGIQMDAKLSVEPFCSQLLLLNVRQEIARRAFTATDGDRDNYVTMGEFAAKLGDRPTKQTQPPHPTAANRTAFESIRQAFSESIRHFSGGRGQRQGAKRVSGQVCATTCTATAVGVADDCYYCQSSHMITIAPVS